MAKTGLEPLPLDGGLQPFNAGSDTAAQPVLASPEVTTPDERDDRDPATQWLDENPQFDANAPAETPSSDPVATEKPATTLAPDAIAKPDAVAKPDVAEVKPEAKLADTATAKPTFAADEKFALAEGNEWTRDQIVAAIKEREAIRGEVTTLKPQVEQYQSLFGSPDDVARNWKPIIDDLRANPAKQEFLDGYLSNPEKAAYLETCAGFFDQQNPDAARPATAAPAAAPVDPVIAREVAELKTWREAQMQRDGEDAMNRDLAQATAKYPMLATDPALMNDLVMTSRYLYEQAKAQKFPQGNRPWLLDALAAKSSIYDALVVARSAQPPTPAPEPVPALNGSPGASPNGSRPATNARPKSFGDLDDAVDDFIKNPPPEFR